jgi:hypothetical protein
MSSPPEAAGKKTDAIAPIGKTISEFCLAYRISRRTFENWRKRGIGPAVTQPAGPGGWGFITLENELAWVRAHSSVAAAIQAAE